MTPGMALTTLANVALAVAWVRDHRHLLELESELSLEACRTRDLEIALRRHEPPPSRWAS